MELKFAAMIGLGTYSVSVGTPYWQSLALASIGLPADLVGEVYLNEKSGIPLRACTTRVQYATGRQRGF